MKTSILPRQVSALFAGACLFAGAFAAVGQAQIVPDPTLHWGFNETGSPTGAADSSGNGRDGTVGFGGGNNITGITGFVGGGYTGFTSAASRVAFSTTGIGAIAQNPISSSQNVTLSLWLKNPGSDSAARNVIAGFGANAQNGNSSLQLWVSNPDSETGERTLGLTWGNWNGQHTVYASESFTWDPNAWYNLSLVLSKGTSQQYSYTVYLTREDDTGLGTPILTGLTPSGATGPANGSFVYIGAQPNSFSNTSPNPLNTAGFFGGDIDEVSLWLGTALTLEQLNENFLETVAAAVPEPSAAALLVGAGVLGLAFGRRRRREHA